MKRIPFAETILNFQAVAWALLAGLFLLNIIYSLGWTLEQDTPLLHYVAFMMDKHDSVPYRDIFEPSMPGTFAFHYVICKLFGYSDFAARCVDLALLGVLLTATYVFMSRFGRLPAIWAGVLYGLVYLSGGPSMSLQKDYIGVIPVVFSLVFIPAKTDITVRLPRFAFVGLMFGLSFLIKPHLGIVLPVAFGTLLAFRWDSGRKSMLDFLKCGMVCTASFLAPLIIAALWLAANSALGPFANIFFNYLPLHNAMTGWHEILSEHDRASYLVNYTLKVGGYRVMVLCAIFAY